MANFTLVFNGTDESGTSENALTAYATKTNEVYISIHSTPLDFECICLDRASAIKFQRELKKQISFLESEVCDG